MLVTAGRPAVAMRFLAFAVAAVLLPFAAAPVAAETPENGLGPVCPLIADFLTLCVGGTCAVYVKTMGGDRYCL